jgi:hypothetical protein
MEIHVFANSQQLGPFSKESVLEMAQLGSLPPDASVWHDGAKDWYPISEFIGKHGGAVSVPAPSVEAVSAPGRLASARGGSDGEPSPTAFVIRGVGAGLATAVVAGGVWLTFSVMTGFWIGWIGLGVGWLVGKMTSVASREEGAAILPISAVVFTVVTYVPVLIVLPLSPWVWLSCAFAGFNAWKAAAN